MVARFLRLMVRLLILWLCGWLEQVVVIFLRLMQQGCEVVVRLLRGLMQGWMVFWMADDREDDYYDYN